MRNLLLLILLRLGGYAGFHVFHDKLYPTPCDRLSKFMDKYLPDVLGPLVYRDENGNYWSHQMPMTHLMQLETTLKTELKEIAPKDIVRYRAAVAVSEALKNLLREQVTAYAKFESSVQGLSKRGATWYQIVERHNVRWAAYSTELLHEVKNLYQKARQAESSVEIQRRH